MDISTNVILGGPVEINVADSATLTISGDISGDYSVTKLGQGDMIFTGANTYSGVTTVIAGTLTLVGSNAWDVVLDSEGAGADIQGVSGKLILDYTGGSSPVDAVFAELAELAESYATGWTGGKFRSATANQFHGLGWVDDDDSQVTIERALYADFNLDGAVTGADLSLLLANYNQTGKRDWCQGDSNYDEAATGGGFVFGLVEF